MPKEHVIVLEPNHTGHRMHYARWIASWLRERDMACTLATASDTFGSAEYREVLEREVKVDTFDLGVRRHVGTSRYPLWVINQLRRVLREFPGASVLLPEGDQVVPFLWLLRPRERRRVGVLVMRVPAETGRLFSNPKRAAVKLVARGGKVRVLSPSVPVSSDYQWRGFAAAPDPVEIARAEGCHPEFLPVTDQQSERVWVGVFGAIHARKNVTRVLDAVMSAAPPNRVGFLLAGKVHDGYAVELQGALAKARERGYIVHLENRFLSDVELDSAVASVDVVAAVYSNDAPSGIFGKAVALGTLVVASGTPALAEAIELLGDRALYCPLTDQALTETMRVAVETATVRHRAPLDLAGPDEFVSAFMETIRRQ
ncbi:hypothetical protein K0817_016255 [Microbacterium sp. HD4P20]|uniref:hypothetical protein n=1 Tax=Microbacterium sp. HD4P20 TaxID=2864874 RepID=UPI001C63EC04|nr:hypothetical protein [Microbacterium sp. HD4P20]MCP2638106.1 hypothetical protein [Microbacterium sp. HD4P20]